MPRPDRRRRRGRLAASLVAWWHRLQGWSISDRNLRIAGVEVDLVARRAGLECLIEVKARRLRGGAALPGPEELLSRGQRRRLLRAARSRALGGRPVRVDLVAVSFGSGLPRLRRFTGLDSCSEVER